jgi:hypothetical protein
MPDEIKQYGYIADEIQDSDYILGGLNLPTEVLREDGQWDLFLPEIEIQRNEKYETFNCTSFGTLNCLETLFKRLFGEERNWSERYVGICAGTNPALGGNSPQKVIETIRKDCGLLNDVVLPMNDADTLEEYYSPNPIPWLMKEFGRKFLEEYRIGHEWLWRDSQRENKINCLKDALQYSPLGCAVCAWEKDGGLYVKPTGAEDNHWCLIFGYDDGKYWKIFDSYDSTIKFLDWNYNFERVKRYHLEKIVRHHWWDFISKWIKEIFK